MGKRKTIVCLETGKQFNSVENAANAIGVSSGFISRQIKAGKPIKGFYYYYAGEMLPDEYRQKIRNQKKKPNKNSRPVICLETGERFESLTLASRMLGTRKSNVFNAIKMEVPRMAFISITVTSRSRLIRSLSLDVEERFVARKPALFMKA